jgi:AcrR family transcriptional regulator
MQHTESMEGVKSRRSQHAADTRAALLKAARRLFGERGYAGVSLDEVCGRARVTKGALYHHFENKQDLFLGVYEQVEDDLLVAGENAVVADADFWSQLSSAGRAFLDVCARPDTRQIILDAPAVLGWAKARAAEQRSALGQLQAGIEAAVEVGVIESSAPAVLAHLLFALFHEAGMTVAASTDADSARADVSAELDRVLLGLRPR